MLILVSSCQGSNSDIDIQQLVSSKGEKLYIVSRTWGVTGDYQLTSITKDKKKFSKGKDTINTVKGLNPFEYRFNNDTLTLYFRNGISYQVQERFESIMINYQVMNHDYYQNRDNSYHNVPDLQPVTVPDMPKPPSND